MGVKERCLCSQAYGSVSLQQPAARLLLPAGGKQGMNLLPSAPDHAAGGKNERERKYQNKLRPNPATEPARWLSLTAAPAVTQAPPAALLSSGLTHATRTSPLIASQSAGRAQIPARRAQPFLHKRQHAGLGASSCGPARRSTGKEQGHSSA